VERFIATSVINAFVYRRGKATFFFRKAYWGRQPRRSVSVLRRFRDTLKVRPETFPQTSGNFHPSTRLSARVHFTEFCCRERFKARTFVFTEQSKELVYCSIRNVGTDVAGTQELKLHRRNASVSSSFLKSFPLKVAVPLQAWSGPESSWKLRFPDYITTAQDGGKVSLTHRPPLPPGNTHGTHFC